MHLKRNGNICNIVNGDENEGHTLEYFCWSAFSFDFKVLLEEALSNQFIGTGVLRLFEGHGSKCERHPIGHFLSFTLF